jgi:hypothetical protein
MRVVRRRKRCVLPGRPFSVGGIAESRPLRGNADFFRAFTAADFYLRRMTIWILALVLFGCLAGIGYQQGAIRVAISFIGIVVAALVAGPLAKLIRPAVAGVGVANPIWQWALPPFVAFVLVLALFKVIAFAVHRKVDVYYKYRAGDLRLALWERLNARLGLCLGLLNALAYLVLIVMVLYPLSYWTVQLATPDAESQGGKDAKLMKLASQMGRDLQRTGLARVARAVDPMPDVFYDAADLAGLLFQNPLLDARLSRYPAFLSLSEKPEFQAIAQDKAFSKARYESRSPIADILKFPCIQAIVTNPDMLRFVWGIVTPNLHDLMGFLKEGVSKKYNDPILGRWYFDPKGTTAAYIRDKNVPTSEMKKFRNAVTQAYAKTSMVVGTDHKVVIKNYPQVKQQPGQPPALELQNLEGQWTGGQGQYELSIGGAGKRKCQVESGRLIIAGEPYSLVFVPED